MKATRRATRILLRKVIQKNFFAQKLPDLAPVLYKLMQLKRVIVGHSNLIFSDCGRALGTSPLAVGQFLHFCS